MSAQIVEWLTWANTQLTPLMDDKLMKVSAKCQTADKQYDAGHIILLCNAAFVIITS
jgi:hypothetical protein